MPTLRTALWLINSLPSVFLGVLSMQRVYNLPSHLPPAIPSREVIPSRFYALGEACTVFDDRDRAIVARFRRSKEIKLIGQVHIDGF